MRALALVALWVGVAAGAPRGVLRVEGLGVELEAPPGAELIELVDWAEVVWAGPRGECKLQLHPQPDDTAKRQLVGTLPLACNVFGAECGAWCERLRPVPGGPATAAYPTESPVIEIDSAWGDRSSDRAGVLVWRDGTVQFRGGACRGYRGRRATVPAARVAGLMFAFELAGLFELVLRRDPQATRPSACAHEIHRLYLRTATRKHVLSWACEPDPTGALTFVYKAVGDNPCAMSSR